MANFYMSPDPTKINLRNAKNSRNSRNSVKGNELDILSKNAMRAKPVKSNLFKINSRQPSKIIVKYSLIYYSSWKKIF